MALSRRKKIIIGIVAGVLLLSIILISIFAGRKDVPEATIVKLETKKELRSTVTASGEVRPIQFINLTSEVAGRIEEIYVKAGDVVTKGQPLVRLDPDQLQSNTDAQTAAFQAAQNESQVTRSQIIAAQNQLSQAQQGQIASDAAYNTALQSVASAKESVNQSRQQVVASQTDVDRAQVEVNAANRELRRSTELLESGVISRIEYDQAKDRVENAMASLNNAKARLESQQIAVKEAQSRVNEAIARANEAKARANQQAVSVKDARRGVDTANLSANASNNRANQAAAVLRGQKSQRDKTLQIAPINGVIADIPSKVGTFAVAGLSTTALLTIADMSTINIEVKVDETEYIKVKEGQAAKVKVDAFGEKELSGVVVKAEPLAQGKSATTGGLSTNINTQEAKEFKVIIELREIPDDVRNNLRPGMSATATITTNTAQNIIAVPLQAMVEKQPESPTPTPEGMKNDVQTSEKPKPIKGVFILEDGKKAKFVEVTTGITGDSDIEIKSGLTADQEIITGPSRVLKTLKDGDVVKRQVKKEGENANK
ncbi:MAG: efflux RND transporter periplasmic adaptor subunit [Pyrinomonadaceae bacterium]|nr:efflux RND transporter periplasmic adaptor subunit [Pyrinomonadaceae bacterium]